MSSYRDGNRNERGDQSNRNDRDDGRSTDRKMSRDSGERGMSDSRRGDGSSRNAEMNLEPAGWVRIAADYDNDGQYESIESIYVYDLERARQDSRNRANRQANRQARQQQDRGQQDQNSRWNGRNGQSNEESYTAMNRSTDSTANAKQRSESVEGKIVEKRMEDFAGIDGKQVIARVKTDDGRTAKVCLGPASKLKPLDLQQGDRVSVQGERGRINGKTVLMAQKVSSGGDNVSVELPSSRFLKRVRGEVLQSRKAKFRGQDERHVVARVRLVNGKSELVNLGPVSKLNSLDLENGDRVSLLVRPGRINGTPAMIAEQVRNDGETVELPRPDDQKRFRMPQNQSASAGNQGDQEESSERVSYRSDR
ncbi:hypothetical protein FYK55_07465 [Roseiconus nitratireducens]|uniref:Magnetosome protein MamS/MamX domain-containing protein n=1 Tax=Roseiconus nitratireducens TaxID=2605748 RepID=A0A5M6DD26_9BACT|nr:hypothetical protein [Roseiconus nitratireducens]KAA5545477.1 hypothetical protein FYK55_07465 [Roseiconus nitratireducens]